MQFNMIVHMASYLVYKAWMDVFNSENKVV